ncbi:MAG: LptE family protein [Bacteroidales bacterium]|nr:LptE family protein [Bacteroidales bacterium]
MRLFYLLFIVLILNSCKINYSFTGASVSPNVKTVSIQYFPNQAPLVHPLLSQVFTEAMKDKFVSRTSLELINGIGDLNFEGYISDYTNKPTSIQRESAAENRLTISIKVKFSNSINPEQDFETSFSAFEDYESSQNLSDVEDQLIEEIIDKIIEDIFNKSVANW